MATQLATLMACESNVNSSCYKKKQCCSAGLWMDYMTGWPTNITSTKTLIEHTVKISCAVVCKVPDIHIDLCMTTIKMSFSDIRAIQKTIGYMMQYLQVDIILPSIAKFFDSHFSFSDKVNGRIDSSKWSFPPTPLGHLYCLLHTHTSKTRYVCNKYYTQVVFLPQ